MHRQTTFWTAEDDLLSLFTDTVKLAPTQQKVAEQLLAAAAKGTVCLVEAGPGMGKTSILRWLRSRLGGVFVTARQWVAASMNGGVSPLFIDDLHLVTPTAETAARLATHKSAVFSTTDGSLAKIARSDVAKHAIKAFKPEDYARICHRYLGDATDRLDMSQIHRAAPALNGYQLKHACLCLGLRYASPSTSAFLECL